MNIKCKIIVKLKDSVLIQM